MKLMKVNKLICYFGIFQKHLLIYKLHKLGFPGKLILWIIDYLKHRTSGRPTG